MQCRSKLGKIPTQQSSIVINWWSICLHAMQSISLPSYPHQRRDDLEGTDNRNRKTCVYTAHAGFRVWGETRPGATWSSAVYAETGSTSTVKMLIQLSQQHALGFTQNVLYSVVTSLTSKRLNVPEWAPRCVLVGDSQTKPPLPGCRCVTVVGDRPRTQGRFEIRGGYCEVGFILRQLSYF